MGQNDDNQYVAVSSSSSCDMVFETENHFCLEPFVHQVGGHGSVLTWDESTVCKPYSSRERQFYEILPCEFKDFVPEFKGVIEVSLVEDSSGCLTLTAYNKFKPKHHRKINDSKSTSLCGHRSLKKIKLKRSGSLELETEGTVDVPFTDECSGTSARAYQQNPWAMQCQSRQLKKMRRKTGETQQFLMLENLVSSFNLPCILDLKMGVRQYGDDASEAKRKSQALKCQGSTSSMLGVRMCGMQVYHSKSGVFKCHNKYYGRTLDVDGLKSELHLFWDNGIDFRYDLLGPCLTKLKALKELLEHANGYRFYASSLLIIYDGDVYSTAGGIDVRMIDFEHSTCNGFRTDPPHEGVDQGYILGLHSLIDILNEFLLSAPPSGENANAEMPDFGCSCSGVSLEKITNTDDTGVTMASSRCPATVGESANTSDDSGLEMICG